MKAEELKKLLEELKQMSEAISPVRNEESDVDMFADNLRQLFIALRNAGFDEEQAWWIFQYTFAGAMKITNGDG